MGEHAIKTAARGVREDGVHVRQVAIRLAEEIANDELLDKPRAMALIKEDVAEAAVQLHGAHLVVSGLAGIPVAPVDLPLEAASPIDQNDLAKRVKAGEGGKVKVSIAQVKEVQGIVLDELAAEVTAGNTAGVLELLRKRAG